MGLAMRTAAIADIVREVFIRSTSPVLSGLVPAVRTEF